jgi:hypothetical protein
MAVAMPICSSVPMIAFSAPPPLSDSAHRMGEEGRVEALGAVRDREAKHREQRRDRRDEGADHQR